MPFGSAALVGLGVIDGLLAVEPQLDMVPLAADPIVVPAVGMDDLLPLLGSWACQNLVAARLFVKIAPPLRVHVGLVAGHLGAFGHPLAAELNAAVGVLADQLALRR